MSGNDEIIGDGGSPSDDLEINESGQLKTVLDGKVDTNNSTMTPMLASETYQGVSSETLDYSLIFITVFSDVASIVNGLCIEISSDGITWRDSDCYTVPAGVEKTFSFQANKRFFRVRYNNGPSDQTIFDLQTVFKKTNSKPSSHKINDAIIGEDDATLSKSVLTGENPAGDFVNFKSTMAGNFKMSLEELENNLSVNNNTQLRTTLYDEAGHPADIDPVTQSMQIVEYEHHEIHEGDHYFLCNWDALGLNETTDIVFTTPDTTKWGHFLFSFNGNQGVNLSLYEGCSNVVDGIAQIIYNNNRNSLRISGMSVIKNPSSITLGNVLKRLTAGANKAVGAIDRSKEIMLMQDTIYLLRATSPSPSNNVGYCLDWYEHTDKN